MTTIDIRCDQDIPPGRAYLMPPDSEMRRILAHAPDVSQEDLMKMASLIMDEPK